MFVKKVSASEPLTRRRKGQTVAKPRDGIVLGTRLPACRCYGIRRIGGTGEPDVTMARENFNQKTLWEGKYRGAARGGTFRSCDEASVTEVERRGLYCSAFFGPSNGKPHVHGQIGSNHIRRKVEQRGSDFRSGTIGAV